MADNLLVAKWTLINTGEEPVEVGAENSIQFYKDGSCLVPVKLLGGSSDAFPMYFFYQAFENHTIKFESGEPGMFLYRYAVEGAKLTVSAMDGREFIFIREEKKSLKSKLADVVPGRNREDAPGSEYKDLFEPDDNGSGKPPVPDLEPEEHEWKCPSCGKINQNYVGTCGCGEPKPKDKPAFNWAEVHPELVKKPEPEEVVTIEPEKKSKPEKEPEPLPEIEPEAHEWKCPNCGKINQNYVGTCGCGEPKPKDKPAFNWAEVHPELVKKPEAEEVVEEEPEKKTKAAKEPEPVPEVEPQEYEWKCPNCGKINQNYVGTCGCGEPKPKDKPAFNWAEVHPELVKKPEPEEEVVAEEPEKKAAKEPEPEPEIEPEAHEWKCPSCGKINQNYVGTCGCGEPKPKDKPAFNWAEVHPELVKKPEPEEAPIEIKPEKKAKAVKEPEPVPEVQPEAHEWKCPSCGKINQNYVGTCGCGERKPVDKPAFNWAEVHPDLVNNSEEPAENK